MPHVPPSFHLLISLRLSVCICSAADGSLLTPIIYEETSQGVIQLLVHLGTILIMMHHYCVGRVPFSVHERSSHCFFFRELALLSFNFTFGFPSRVPCPSRFLHPHPLTVNAASVCPEFILIGESLIWPPAVILVRHC